MTSCKYFSNYGYFIQDDIKDVPTKNNLIRCFENIYSEYLRVYYCIISINSTISIHLYK